MSAQRMVLGFPIQTEADGCVKILMACKRTKIAKGKQNGFGGKVKDDETVRHAMVRELAEEVHLIAEERALQQIAVLRVYGRGSESLTLKISIDVFLIHDCIGTPRNSDEMEYPQWHDWQELPRTDMLSTDSQWLPEALDLAFQPSNESSEQILFVSIQPFSEDIADGGSVSFYRSCAPEISPVE